MSDTLGTAVCATAIWLMFAVAIVFDVPKAPRSELWAPTLSEKFKVRPPFARVGTPLVDAWRTD
jgi:hypothetical protein